MKHTVKKHNRTIRKVVRKNKTRRVKKQTGGMLTSALSAARQAFLPYLLYIAQKNLKTRKNK